VTTLRKIPVWPFLALAMALSALWIMLGGRHAALGGDEVFYYADLVEKSGAVIHLGGIEGLFAPHNGHFVLVGRLIYKLLFAIAGANHYWVFRAVEVAGILIAVELFYLLARRRTEPWVALAMCVSLLFAGWAYETLLWPFDLHTVYALVFGLAAVLALEREDRRGDIVACALLVLAVATLEIGLAFVVGVAVSILLRGDRWRRIWIVVVPVAVYGIWWLWAGKFHQSEVRIENLHLIPTVVTGALGSIAGSLTGINPTGMKVEPNTAGPTAAGMVIAGVAVVALVFRIRRGTVPPSLWLFLGTTIAFWLTIALGGREPETSRYIFVGSLLVLLVAADAIAGVRFTLLATGGVFLVVLLALGPDLAKFGDGEGVFASQGTVSRAELGMVDLAAAHVVPTYTPGADPHVQEKGGGLFVPITAGDYLENEADKGSMGMSLDELRSQPQSVREVADATLIGADGIALRPHSEPGDLESCASVGAGEVGPEDPGNFKVAAGGALLGSTGSEPVTVRLSRFADGGGTEVGTLAPGEWGNLRIPKDAVGTPWRAIIDGPLYICPVAK
jgi:hypothetical protein